MHWRSASATHTGLVRQLNEDAVLERPEIGLWAVADGMGGHAKGDVASQTVMAVLQRMRAAPNLSTFVEFAEHQITQANDYLLKLARQGSETIGTTVITLLVHGAHCAFLWAGDSRLYRWRRGWLQQLSSDHSKVTEYVKLGLITASEANSHPDGNLITRAVGASPDLRLECNLEALEVGDRFLLCSDGLNKHVEFRSLANLLGQGPIEQVPGKLIDATIRAGATDNVTVCAVEITD